MAGHGPVSSQHVANRRRDAVNNFLYCKTLTANCFGVDLWNIIPSSIQPRSGGIRYPRTRVRGLCRPNLASREAMTSMARP